MLIKTLQSRLLARGFDLSRTTDAAEVAALARRCAPVASDVPLIRLGGEEDGGYLVPDDLDGVVRCFSPGVNDQVSFELDLAERGIPSSLADFSIDGPPVAHPAFDFEALYVGAVDGDATTSLASWVARLAPDEGAGDLMLQMDIEGAEYPALLAAPPELLARFRVLVVEFHHLNKLFDPLAFLLLSSCFEKLLARFDVVHLHPNNALPVYRVGDLVVPQAMEFTWLRRERHGAGAAPSFPHPLDRPCDPGRPELALPACWRARSPKTSG